MKLLLLCIVSTLVIAMTSAFSVPESSLKPANFIPYPSIQQPNQQVGLNRGLLAHLLQVLNFIAGHGLDVVSKLQQDVDRALDDLAEQTQHLLELANQDIDEYIHEAKQNLTANENHISDCLSIVPQRLQQIAEQSAANARECHDELVARVNILSKNVKEHVEFFVSKLEEIQNITETCVDENDSLLGQIQCVLSHVDEAGDIVRDILDDAGKLLKETIQETISLANDTRNCLLDVVRQAKSDVDGLVSEVLDCLNQEPAQF